MRSIQQILEAGGYLRKPEVLLLGGFKNSTLYSKIRAKQFPAPLKLFGTISVWSAQSVKEWMKQNEVEGK